MGKANTVTSGGFKTPIYATPWAPTEKHIMRILWVFVATILVRLLLKCFHRRCCTRKSEKDGKTGVTPQPSSVSSATISTTQSKTRSCSSISLFPAKMSIISGYQDDDDVTGVGSGDELSTLTRFFMQKSIDESKMLIDLLYKGEMSSGNIQQLNTMGCRFFTTVIFSFVLGFQCVRPSTRPSVCPLP